jgi:prevent-host-death family protein
MRTPVNIHEAKTHFSRLLARVELGEEIIISNRGLPVAKLVPYQPSNSRLAALGMDRGLYTVPEDFNELPPDLLAAFYGDSSGENADKE